MKLDLTNEQTVILLRELDALIDGDRFPLSPRVRMLKEIRALLRPEPLLHGPTMGNAHDTRQLFPNCQKPKRMCLAAMPPRSARHARCVRRKIRYRLRWRMQIL